MEHVAAALANWALRPARVTGGGGPLFRGSWDWASEGILNLKKKRHHKTIFYDNINFSVWNVCFFKIKFLNVTQACALNISVEDAIS